MPKNRPAGFYLARARQLAARRGGKLLSRRYVSDSAKLRARCSAGHVFLISSSDLLQSHWCRICAIKRRAALKTAPMLPRLRRIAAEQGGVVVSSRYVNNFTPLRYRCARGHEWETDPSRVFKGRWCPTCAASLRREQRREAVVARLRALASRTGYTLLPPWFVGANDPIFLRCSRGHVWQTSCASFEDGVRCSTCREEDLLGEMRAIAERQKGKCLATEVPNLKVRLPWRCAQGHRFMASGSTVRRGGWCQTCRAFVPGSIGRMKRLARERRGWCLSSKYVDAWTKLAWKCREEHEWRADPASIVEGSWCPICSRFGYSRAKLSIADLHETAQERGGECLARQYHNNKSFVRWRCARGHVRRALPSRVRQGSWCPRCAHTLRGTIEAMKAYAIERAGLCLSIAWDDHRRQLLFECARGHRFWRHPAVLRTGLWCPRCA